jgi:hypothetical protein
VPVIVAITVAAEDGDASPKLAAAPTSRAKMPFRTVILMLTPMEANRT